jgi:hypothetical protein
MLGKVGEACEAYDDGPGKKKKGNKCKKKKGTISWELNRRKGGGSGKMSKPAKKRLRRQGVKMKKFR